MFGKCKWKLLYTSFYTYCMLLLEFFLLVTSPNLFLIHIYRYLKLSRATLISAKTSCLTEPLYLLHKKLISPSKLSPAHVQHKLPAGSAHTLCSLQSCLFEQPSSSEEPTRSESCKVDPDPSTYRAWLESIVRDLPIPWSPEFCFVGVTGYQHLGQWHSCPNTVPLFQQLSFSCSPRCQVPCIPFRFSECIRDIDSVWCGLNIPFSGLCSGWCHECFYFQKSSIKRLPLFSHENQIPCQHHGGS